MVVRLTSPAVKNALLAALPPTIYECLKPSLTSVRLEEGKTLYDVGSTVDHAWFILSGIVSLLTITKDGVPIEIAAISREGVVGHSGVTRKNSMEFRAQVQVSGEAMRIRTKVLRAALGEGIASYEPLLDYTHTLNRQIAQAVLCNRLHKIEERLACWLLLAHGRTLLNPLPLTHEAISQILGVSRSVVSEAAGGLQRRGFIRYSRGRIAIRDRLKTASCECYEAIARSVNSTLPS